MRTSSRISGRSYVTRSTRTSSDEENWKFPIGPVLVHFGGEFPMEDRGWAAYKCPFHGDRQASASVSTIINVFNCHACGMKGSAIDLLMKEDGLDFKSAVARCEEITGESYGKVRGSGSAGSSLSGRAGNRQGSRTRGRTWRSD